MSKASTTVKVLRTGLKRIQSRWIKRHFGVLVPDGEGGEVQKVCMVGALTGGCTMPVTNQQREALKLIEEAAAQLFPLEFHGSIPALNDSRDFTQEDAEKIFKLALIKAETGALEDDIAAEVDAMLDEADNKKNGGVF